MMGNTDPSRSCRHLSLAIAIRIRRVLLPHKTRAVVRHRAVPVVDEAAFGGAARRVETILACTGAKQEDSGTPASLVDNVVHPGFVHSSVIGPFRGDGF